MKIGSNFDSNIFKMKRNNNKERYQDNYYISRHHIVYLFKNIFLSLVIVLMLLLYVMTTYIVLNNPINQITYFSMIVIIILIMAIYWKYIKYMNTFFVFNPDEIMIIEQKSLFKRNVKVIQASKVRAIDVTNKSIFWSIFHYWSLKIMFDNNVTAEIDYFKWIQKLQTRIREIVFRKE